MNHKQRRFYINTVLNAAKSLQCKDLHHKKSHQHESGEVCMAEYELNKSIHIVEQILENARPESDAKCNLTEGDSNQRTRPDPIDSTVNDRKQTLCDIKE